MVPEGCLRGVSLVAGTVLCLLAGVMQGQLCEQTVCCLLIACCAFFADLAKPACITPSPIRSALAACVLSSPGGLI